MLRLLTPEPPYDRTMPVFVAYHVGVLSNFFGVRGPVGLRVEVEEVGDSYVNLADGTMTLSAEEINKAAEDAGIEAHVSWGVVGLHEGAHLVVESLRRERPKTLRQLTRKTIIERRTPDPDSGPRSAHEAVSDLLVGVALGLSLEAEDHEEVAAYLKQVIRSQAEAGCLGGYCEHGTPTSRALNLARGLSLAGFDNELDEDDDEDDDGEDFDGDGWMNNEDLSGDDDDQEEDE